MRDALPTFESPAFVERLDVLFAEFYLQAYEASEAPAWISKAWAPLFDRRAEHRLPLQFAITGMNAHINNDLAHALVADVAGAGPGWRQPERRDYEKVNDILEAVEANIKVPLSDDVIADVDSSRHDDDNLALWSIRRARDQAWERARSCASSRATSSTASSTSSLASRATSCWAATGCARRTSVQSFRVRLAQPMSPPCPHGRACVACFPPMVASGR